MLLKKLITALETIAKEFDKCWKESESTIDLLYGKEISNLTKEILSSIYHMANVNDLEDRLKLLSRVDTHSLIRAFSLIEEFEGTCPISCTDFTAKFKFAKERVESISEKEEQIGEYQLSVIIDIELEVLLIELMSNFPAQCNIFNEFYLLVIAKLKQIKDEDMFYLWNNLVARYASSASKIKFPHYEDIIPKDFFQGYIDLRNLREKYARFICQYKPLTIQRMMENGLNFIPANEIVGVLRILSTIENGSTIRPLSPIEKLILNSISRVIAIYQKIISQPKNCENLGIKKNSILTTVKEFSEYASLTSKLDSCKKMHLFVMNITRLVDYTEEYIEKSSSKVEIALWQYKLGMEVTASPEQVTNEKNEIQLQRELCKFLIERGILSYGRIFGRSEIDLYIENDEEVFVIETKIYTKKPSDKKLQVNVAQTFSYCDQIVIDSQQMLSQMMAERQKRGILVIFNKGDDFIEAPRRWLKGRIWILAINIGVDLAPHH